MLTPVMTVAENVVIGSEPVRGVFFDRKKAEAQVAAMIDEYNFHISATAKVETLSVGEQQRVEILKALYRGADLLILDEVLGLVEKDIITEDDLKALLECRGDTDVILTGITLNDEICVLADEVSKIETVKFKVWD